MATVRDAGYNGFGVRIFADTLEPVIVVNTNYQHATIFTGNSVLSRIHAWVCGECGYMPLFADDPQALYAAYQEFLRATQGENRAL